MSFVKIKGPLDSCQIIIPSILTFRNYLQTIYTIPFYTIPFIVETKIIHILPFV